MNLNTARLSRLSGAALRDTVRTFVDSDLLAALTFHQNVQKANPPTSKVWRDASRVIRALSAENAVRHGTAFYKSLPTYAKW